jgi:hypothetical protein
MKTALIRTIGILALLLLLGDAALCVALLFGFHHRKIEAEPPESPSTARMAGAQHPVLPITNVSLISQPPRPAPAESPVAAVEEEEAPLSRPTPADLPDRPHRASPLRTKSMITHAGQN